MTEDHSLTNGDNSIESTQGSELLLLSLTLHIKLIKRKIVISIIIRI